MIPIVAYPEPGMVISVLLELDKPATVCTHDRALRPMCTIIPLAERPDDDADGPWILSCWGNGPGIVCFLDEWDGNPFYDVEVIKVNRKSVTARPLSVEEEVASHLAVR